MSSQTMPTPKPIEEPKEILSPLPHPATTSKPVLTINSNEDQSSAASASDVQCGSVDS